MVGSDRDGQGRERTVPGVVTFDLWHTLVYLSAEDEEAYSRTQIELAVEALRSAPSLRGDASASDPVLARQFELVLAEAVGSADRGVTITPGRQIAIVGERTGRRPDVESYLRRLAEAVQRQPWRLAAGAIETLAGVSKLGLKVGVISNTVGEEGSSLRPWIDRAGLGGCVDVWTFSNERPWTKPAPQIFHATLERLGGSPASAVHVGDGWADIEGARRAMLRASVHFTGLQEYGDRYRALHAPSGRVVPPPTRTITHLPDLLTLLPDLLPA